MAITARQMKHATAGPALTQEQQLAYFLTPEQQQGIFDRRQQAEGAIREADISGQEAQAQHDIAVAQLQQARAKSAQGAVDEMIARGMLQSGTARGALADIEVAAFQQRQSLDIALTATQQRNLAVRSAAEGALKQIGTYAQGQAGENIKTGVRSMPSGAPLPAPGSYAQPSGPVSTQTAKPAGTTPPKTTWGQPIRVTPSLGKPKKAQQTTWGQPRRVTPGY